MRLGIELTSKEKKILFIALNNLQSQGLNDIIIKSNKLFDVIKDTKLLDKCMEDWLNQTTEEYDIINCLKAKLQVWEDE